MSSPSSQTPAPVRAPKQQRTRERLERIYEAAERLFVEQGFAGTSMRDIARAVPCSMSAIYDRFGSKDVLLQAMHDRHRERTLGRIAERAPRPGERVDLRDLVGRLVYFSQNLSEHNRGLRRAILARAAYDPELSLREKNLRDEYGRLAYGMIMQGREQIRHPEPEVAADYVARLISAVMMQRFDVDFEPAARPLSDEQLAQQTLLACLAYLGVTGDAVP